METEKRTVTIEIPKEIVAIVTEITANTDLSPDQVFSYMASFGLNNHLENLIKQKMPQQEKTPQLTDLKHVGLDTSKLESGLEKMNGLMNQIQQMQKVLNVNQYEDKKNNK